MKKTTAGSVLFALLFAVFTFGFIPNALAQSDKKKAQALFEKGAALYYDGKYAEALVQFKKGHAAVPNALFLYNMSLCNLKLERYREALANATDARQMEGLPEKEGTRNDARIVSIGLIQTSQHLAESVPDPVADVTTDDATVPDTSTPDDAPPPRKGMSALGWSGVAGLVVGGALLGGAVATEVSLQSKWDEFTELSEGGDPERFEEVRQEIERGQRNGKILLYTGTGVAVVGATLLVVELVTSPNKNERPNVGLLVTPDGHVGATVQLRF